MPQTLATVLLALAASVHGQQAFVGDMALAASVGTRLTSMNDALKQSDFTATTAAYTAAPSPTLQSLGQTSAYSTTSPSMLRQLFAAYWGNAAYADDFIVAAINANTTFWGVDLALRETNQGDGDKTREELAMKGVALQSVMLAVFDGLHAAWDACLRGDTSTSQQYVNESWAYYAAPKGPIALGEKRCPQFDTCQSSTMLVNNISVQSKVNFEINRQFVAAFQHATTGSCASLASARDAIKSQIYVPVIQGMMREAYESDPNGGAEDADGFVEVAEGWAFTAAVLPLIAECSASAASTIRTNMDTLGASSTSRFPVDGYLAVVQAVEGTYPCLGITCSDVKAMVDSDTGSALWRSCTTSSQGAGSGGDDDDSEGWQTATIVLCVVAALLLVALVVTVLLRRRAQPTLTVNNVHSAL